MPARPLASWATLRVATIALLCAACSAVPAASSSTPTAGAAATTAAPSAAHDTPSPPDATATPRVSPGPPSIEPASPSPSGAPGLSEPPAAALAVEGGDPVVGELGSFTWNNGGSDAPWVPGTPLRMAIGEQLTLSLAADVPIEHWTVRRTPASSVGTGVTGMGEGSSDPVTVPAPPRGSWSVAIEVWFAGNLGSAAYYWLVTVG